MNKIKKPCAKKFSKIHFQITEEMMIEVYYLKKSKNVGKDHIDVLTTKDLEHMRTWIDRALAYISRKYEEGRA